MQAKLIEKVPAMELRRRMDRAAELLIHRAAKSHIAIFKQLAARDTGLMADTSYVDPEQPTGAMSSFYIVWAVSPQPYSAYPEFGTVNQVAQPAFVPGRESAGRQIRTEARTIVNLVMSGGTLAAV